MQTTEITENVTWQTGTVDPLHENIDSDKVHALATSMTERGWVGAPIVVDGDRALTGTHRLAAVRMVQDEGYDLAWPAVEIADLCAEHGLSWTAIREDNIDWYGAVVQVSDLLPADVCAAYGLDAH
jgi:hypothetical protein